MVEVAVVEVAGLAEVLRPGPDCGDFSVYISDCGAPMVSIPPWAVDAPAERFDRRQRRRRLGNERLVFVAEGMPDEAA